MRLRSGETARKAGRLAGATVAVVAGTIAIAMSAHCGYGYVEEIGSGCGTVRLANMAALTTNVPSLLVAATLGWQIARRAPIAGPIARCVALSAVTAWIVTMVTLHIVR